MKRFYIAVVLILMMILQSYEASFSQDAAKYVSSMTWSSDSKLIALGFEDGDIQIIDSETNEIMHQFNVEGRKIQWLDWHPQESLLAIGSQNGIVYIWDADSHTYLHEITELPFFSISRVYWNPSGDYLFITQLDASLNLHIWNLEDGKFEFSLDIMEISDISWNQSDLNIAVGHFIPHTEIYSTREYEYERYVGSSLDNLRQQRQNSNITNIITNIEWDSSGNYMMSSSADGIITLWDIYSNTIIHQFDNSVVPTYTYDGWFSNQDTYIGSIAGDGTLRIWQVESGNLLLDIEIYSPITYSLVSPDKTKLAYVDEQNELHIVEINDLITAQIRLKIAECVADDELHTQLNDFLNNDDNAGFINHLDVADLDTISRECADTLLEMAALLLEAE